MKRKGGSKKAKGKKPKLVSTTDVTSNGTVDIEKEPVMGGSENQEGSSVAAEAKKLPSPSRANDPEKAESPDLVQRPINSTVGKVVYTRVKVKLKTSKKVESPPVVSDVPAKSDTDKSSHQVSSEKPVGHNEKLEESSNSLSDTDGGASANTIKKLVGIKIKSSKGLGSSSTSPCSNTEVIKEDLIEKKDAESQQDSRHNEQELKLALEVIRKVMKMDAAEPFNAPVDAVSLGIPDYYDVIHTPMDFGTICHNLEKGLKYKNAEDVLNDVRYIWDNCYKYNNKGDFIVELMKRVKKGFTKYWTAVGLFNCQTQENIALENDSSKDPATPTEANTPAIDSALILSGKKFHGLKKHKEGCLCAICVMMRRRQEKEEIARMMGQTDSSDDSHAMDTKPEGVSHGESPFDGYTSSNIVNSPNVDADQELKLGNLKKLYGKQTMEVATSRKQEISHDLHLSGRSENTMNNQEGSNGSLSNDAQNETGKKNDDGNSPSDHQRPKEPLDRNQRAKMLENLRYLENPVLLDLYGTLFSNKPQSFWNGPRSLVGHRKGSNGRTSLGSVMSAFLK